MLKMQSEAHPAVGTSQILKTNMEFMMIAMEFNLPNLEEIRKATKKSFLLKTILFLQQILAIHKPHKQIFLPLALPMVIESPLVAAYSLPLPRLTIIQWNQLELVELSSYDLLHNDEHFALTRRSALDKSDETKEYVRLLR